VLRRFRAATNMTDSAAALSMLADQSGPERDAALSEFYAKWVDQPLVLLKWFSVQERSLAPIYRAVCAHLFS
jgi:aminopeptidase N